MFWARHHKLRCLSLRQNMRDWLSLLQSLATILFSKRRVIHSSSTWIKHVPIVILKTFLSFYSRSSETVQPEPLRIKRRKSCRFPPTGLSTGIVTQPKRIRARVPRYFRSGSPRTAANTPLLLHSPSRASEPLQPVPFCPALENQEPFHEDSVPEPLPPVPVRLSLENQKPCSQKPVV